MDIPNLAIVYATCGANHLVSMFSGGEIFKMCGFVPLRRCGMQHLLNRNVPRVLIECIKS